MLDVQALSKKKKGGEILFQVVSFLKIDSALVYVACSSLPMALLTQVKNISSIISASFLGVLNQSSLTLAPGN